MSQGQSQYYSGGMFQSVGDHSSHHGWAALTATDYGSTLIEAERERKREQMKRLDARRRQARARGYRPSKGLA